MVEKNTSSAIPLQQQPPPLNPTLREIYPPLSLADSQLRYNDTGQLDESKSDYYFRHCQPFDLPIIKTLHKEWFPLDYGEAFFHSTCSGEYYSIAAVWKGNKNEPNSLQPQRSRAANCASAIASFFNPTQTRSEFSQAPELIVGLAVLSFTFPIAKEDLMMIIKFSTLQRLLQSPMTQSDYDNLQQLAEDPKDMQRIRHTYYNELLWEYVRNSEEDTVAAIRNHTSYVLTLGTIEEVRGKGIATEILSQVKKEICKRGSKLLMLHVATYNDAAIQAYKKSGFKVVSYCENFYEIAEKPYHAYLAVWVSDIPCPPFDEAIDKAARWLNNIEYLDPSCIPPWR
eukprot:Protomagalhaensia_sp_Gyna_25__1477@NODE_1753_length_1560_cov_45_871137_g1436_i0_p1_GENE_NODE_1753_length_1560_cov_45_871137_g1436_i0NODE_1753_length_1560_cov_45_871137_g1436_i0_p1_ORF_typecomplete_len341_score34_85FR47/PF08445_10/2_5e10Acetyltransf_1/PF00583_25/2_4e09Acetyltransf_10/PF13673_7/8_2e08GNAT_acetyltran/PF12746_7/1_1e06Acetyltransf_7/PF13508_7/3_4e06Acetyltransf_4/PF13420_7/1_8e03Acetyltransf_4/PF13420_7/7_5e06Acetyltransf_3/PF13302_7/0_00035Gly_acyl_tr_C/PF08444_10/0_00013Acetyltrans